MNRISKILAVAGFAMLSACSNGAEDDAANNADEFAARINGDGTAAAPQGDQAPQIAQPLPNAAPGAFTPGTATDPASETCGANRMGQFLGKPADDGTRNAIMEVGSDVSQIRFLAAGSAFVKPDPTSPRLNIMLDEQGVIRDARCG